MSSFTLDHIIRKSSLQSNAPLLIMLHGYGSDENDLFSFASELPEELYIISAKAPYPMHPFGNAWYAINFDAEKGKWSDNEQAMQSRDKIATFIEEAIANYPVNKENVTILGFSQGTILSYAVALTYPNLIKNVVALSGYINTKIVPEEINTSDLSHLSIYCSHGTVDQVIPVEWARKSPELLSNLGIEYKYSEFPVGHGVAPQNFYEFKAWLESRI